MYELWVGSNGDVVGHAYTLAEARQWLADRVAKPYRTEITCNRGWFGFLGPDAGDMKICDL